MSYKIKDIAQRFPENLLLLPKDQPSSRDAADPIALSDGNVFTSVDYGMSTHGDFGIAGNPKRTANTWRARC